MKIVWLCHFANSEIKSYFKTPKIKEKAPWINNLIELFRERTDIELHIVAPNIFNNRNQEIVLKGIHYHFYVYRPCLITEKLYPVFRILTQTNFFLVKKKIGRIINGIQPDLIHLHGAENAYYSSGILNLFDKYPVLVTIQGFIRNSTAPKILIGKSINIEEAILKKSSHIGVRTKEMSEIVLRLNPKATLHFHNYPVTIPSSMKDIAKPSAYDIVFFARINKDKGIEDLIEAVAIVKKQLPGIKLHVIGRVRKRYLFLLEKKIERLHLKENIDFLGFMDTQQDIYRHAINARICVLPTHHDIIPGTVIESMFMKVPVVAYAVGGIPDLNDKGETVVLVEKNNISALSAAIVDLLKNKDKRDVLSERAYTYAKMRFNNSDVPIDIMKAYDKIIHENLKQNHLNHG